MNARMSAMILALLSFAACHRLPTSAQTAEEAVEITDAYRAERTSRPYPTRVQTEDLGDRWSVSYTRAGGGTGGLAYYEVNKANGHIVREGGEQ